jgi:hypothetical protein
MLAEGGEEADVYYPVAYYTPPLNDLILSPPRRSPNDEATSTEEAESEDMEKTSSSVSASSEKESMDK